jgi:predicted phage terminase large subunit-like protein
MFPVWLWVKDPSLRIISGSHSSSLAMRHAARSRDIIRSEKFQFYFGERFEMRKDFDSKGYYMNTQKGERQVTSVGANITGSHAHLLLVDDPINVKEVISETILETACNWVDKTLSTRVVEKSQVPTVQIMQRAAGKDPSGEWLRQAEKEGRQIRHLCIPSEDKYRVNPPELRKYYQNGLMDEKRLSREVLDAFHAKLGSDGYSGQFGQDIKPPGGNIITEAMLPILEWFSLPDAAKGVTVNFVIDSSDKEKRHNDPTGCLAYIAVQGYIFILDYFSIRARFSRRLQALQAFVEKYGSPNSRVYIEPKSSGIAMYQYLSDNTKLNAEEWQMSEGDKVRRAQAITPFLEQNRVFLMRGAWNRDFITACTGFPKLAHDEEVDVLVMAVTNGIVRGEESYYNFYD